MASKLLAIVVLSLASAWSLASTPDYILLLLRQSRLSIDQACSVTNAHQRWEYTQHKNLQRYLLSLG